MRILIKGGVWKNTEDEILKAAVMKYGLNQWARISSLLTRKSAKQCKARWYEWLDPAIRKTEWTREEDEKLLHLAKLMPTQWRTIAPIVGRTPAQCLERYEKLLDMAAGKETYDAADDPRRLRPGEIDPNPESKPARPDPIDMDEDEREMLSEARARLANTKGKKAKRKAREKQLEEARRLATLQKKRELKAAGIEVREYKRRGGAIDYSKEVPFERRAPAGFFDTSDESHRTREMQEEFRPITVDELEGRRKKDIERELVKQDLARERLRERQNAPAALARALAANEAAAEPTRRGKLMLPAPRLTGAAAEAAARGEGAGGLALDEDLVAGGSDATRGLLTDYATPRPGGIGASAMMPPPPPAAPSAQARIMREAANLAALAQGATPLLGGENPELHPSDFGGVTPRSSVPGATPLVGGGAAGLTARREGAGPLATPTPALATLVGATPSRTGGVMGGAGVLPTPTPLRDALGLNEAVDGPLEASKHAEAARLALLRNELRAGLAQLPQPRNEYAVVVPEPPPVVGEEPVLVEDAADAAARRAREREAAAAAELRAASRVVQRGLPRPLDSGRLAEMNAAGAPARPELAAAAGLVAAEMAAMLRYEAARFPDSPSSRNHGAGKGGSAATAGGSKQSEVRPDMSAAPPPLERFAEEELASAARLLDEEVDRVRADMGHGTESADIDAAMASLDAATADVLFVPSLRRAVRGASAAPRERAEAAAAEFDSARREMAREARRAAKLESRASLLSGGLEARHGKLADEAAAGAKSLASAVVDAACFAALAAREETAARERLDHARALVVRQQERETSLQARYAAAVRARADAARSVAAT